MANDITEQENIKVTGLLRRARADEAYPIVLVFILAPASSDVRVRAGGGNARIGDGSAFIDYAEIKFQITAQPVGQENEYCAVFKTEELPKSFRRRANLEDVSSREMIMRFDSNTHRSVFQAIARLENYRLVIAAKERLEQIQKQNSLEIPEAEAVAAVALTYDFGFNCPDAVTLCSESGYNRNILTAKTGQMTEENYKALLEILEPLDWDFRVEKSICN